MKILLINPPWHDKVYSKTVASLAGFTPPIGLASIAAYLRKHGHEVRIIDANAEQISIKELPKYISKGFHIVGTTSLTPSINSSLEVLYVAKKQCPGIITIMGGVHITAMGKETLENFPDIDFGIIGEGEETVLELVNSITGNKQVDSIKGLVFRRGKDVIQNERRPLIRDLDKLPFPAYDLLPMEKYRIAAHHAGFGRNIPMRPFSLIGTTRGCPEDCGFCCSKMMWERKVCVRSPEKVVEEIELLAHKFGVRVFDIADDIFTLNKKRLHDILDRIIARKLNIHFNCLSHVGMVTQEDLTKMKEAGCYLIRFGIESGSQKVLNKMHKNITPEKAIETFRLVKKAKIACAACFMIGYLGETEETVQETIELAGRLDADRYFIFTAIPYPGTEFYETAQKENLIAEPPGGRSWLILPRRGVIKTESLSQEDIILFRNRAYRMICFNLKYMWKFIRGIRTWEQAKMCAKGIIVILMSTGRKQ